MQLYAADPDSMMEVVLVHTASGLLGATLSFDLDDAKKIDWGKYDYVLVMASNSGGTSSCTITPKEADTLTGPEFPLDGTGGLPDHRMTFNASAFESRQRVIRVAGRRRFLQLAAAIGTGTGFRLVLYVVGVRTRTGSGPSLLDTDRTPLTLT